MFGKVLNVDDNLVTIENLKNSVEVNILNYHVAFEEETRKIIGEIVGLNEKTINILLVGEIQNNVFIPGVMKKPNFKTVPRIILKSELELILGYQDITNPKTLYIGRSVTYDNFLVTTEVNNFLANHFAIVGNTGSGKSCGVARIIQNIFSKNYASPTNAHIILFDAYGEYHSAFKGFNSIPNIHYKSYTTKLEFADTEIIKIPTYFLDADDLALLLNATDPSQLPIISKALNLVYVFTSKDPKVLEYKNSIIATCLLDILASGRNPVQIRDQVVAVLSQYHTDQLNLDSIIVQPGYNRTIKQCLNIDAQGKMNAVSFVVDYLETYLDANPNDIEIEKNYSYSLDDLYYAFEFALISEGVFNSGSIYEKMNILKVRLKSIIDGAYHEYFDYPDFISKDDYIKNLFTTDNQTAQIVNMNFNYIDERFAKVLTKIYSKLCFNYAVKLEERTSFPIHIILEEAHRYVQNDQDTSLIGYNIFDRITKEGRKYGVILGFITQRPNELSKTALSQCSNFITYRMYHPEDIEVIAGLSANVSRENIAKIKTLSPGVAMVFGTSFKVPLITKMDLPNPMPESNSVDIVHKWYS